MKTIKVLILFLLAISAFQACKPKAPLTVEEKSIERVKKYKEAGYPVVNLHSHLKGGLTIEQLLENSARTGIDYGVAINCGVGFPIHTDSALGEAFRALESQPVYLALQAEGREWTGLVSPDTIALFDYVFTDAMTFTDLRGKRTRLWIAEEVEVSNVDSFMEHLVTQIETILSTEPIHIYVNPTYLPAVIADRYDELWTPERVERVVKALRDNGIALEINAKAKLPSLKVIQAAKEAGVKFTIGTNNGDANLGMPDYAFDMIDSCGLKPADFWLPVKKRM